MAETKGLVMVFTGDGKGKTTASLGMAMRAWGQGLKVLVLQFIKGTWHYGELTAAEKLGPDFEIRRLGGGFVKDTSGDQFETHRAMAQEALQESRRAVEVAQHDMIILDEINNSLALGLVDLEEVMDIIRSKPAQMHLVLTGRNAPAEIIAQADLVTEMKLIKHPYDAGIQAQKGVEF